MNKIITCVLSLALLFCCSVDANAQKSRSRAKHRTTAVAPQPVGAPIQKIIDENKGVIESIKMAEQQYGPQMVAQLYQTKAWFGPAASVAAENSDYQLTAADKKALCTSFNQVIDSMKPGLVRAGNSQAKVTKMLNGIKAQLRQQINQISILQQFYM